MLFGPHDQMKRPDLAAVGVSGNLQIDPGLDRHAPVITTAN